MARKNPGSKIEFDSPATVAELLDALEDLRARIGPNALVRVTGFIEIHGDGPHVKAISAHPPATRP
jgi:hypothetical protein